MLRAIRFSSYSLLAVLVLAGCSSNTPQPAKKGEKTVDVASVVRQKMPATVKDRDGWAQDLLDKSDAANFDITVFCEEPRIAYDRVHLSSYFSHHTAEELSLVREGFYEKHGIKVLVGERAITINRQEKVIHSSAGRTVFYDKLIMATGSYPWIPWYAC